MLDTKDETISNILLWTTTHGHISTDQLAKTYIELLWVDTGCSLENLPRIMANRDGRWERIKGVCAVGMLWWWCIQLQCTCLCMKQYFPRTKVLLSLILSQDKHLPQNSFKKSQMRVIKSNNLCIRNEFVLFTFILIFVFFSFQLINFLVSTVRLFILESNFLQKHLFIHIC